MMQLKKYLFLLLFLLATHFLAYNFVGNYKKMCLLVYHNRIAMTESVTSQEKLDSILSQFEKKTFVELDQAYLMDTYSEEAPFKKMLSKSEYFELDCDQVFQKIAGDHRVLEFLPKDDYLDDCIINNEKIYWLADPKVLAKFIELENLLLSKSYDIRAITINNGYRYPKYNEEIGGASQSRHIKGEAIDMKIGDLDRNGTIEAADKDIILEVLDKIIIRDEGGLGLYPGTQVVHMDTRGYRARWDSY